MSQDLEELRQDADRLANQLLHSSSKDEALEIAIKAAETSLKALSLVTDPDKKPAYTARAKQLMQEAERIKHSENWRQVINQSNALLPRTDTPVNASTVKLLNEPLNSRKLTTREEIILEKAGFLNGVKFPRWQTPPAQNEFDKKDGEDLFFDESSELPLSDFQLDVLDDWKRPVDALPPPSWFPGGCSGLDPVMSSARDVDLVQDAATDCSVVASLCAIEARTKRGLAPLSQLFIHPYDLTAKQPRMSSNGKYIIRLNFNGSYRKTIIDDRIPASTTERVIHVVDRNNPCLLWPALVEKAYLKVRGGYDFPGSNSGTDLWILTGWIPEQVFLQSDDLEPGQLWKRVANAFSYGDVLITMGTGKMSRKTEREIGLAGEHDYAVLDLREVDGQRLMLVKNPWVEGTSWRGRTRKFSNANKNTPNDTALIQFEDDLNNVDSPRDLLNADQQLRPGTFWMDLDNVVQYFESIYLNWNTGLFSFRQDVHFTWDLSMSSGLNETRRCRNPCASLHHNPQYTVKAEKNGFLWILLWRHFQNFVPEDATPEQIESGRQHIDLNGHITLAVFKSDGRKVVLPERASQKGWFVDSPQTLLKLENCEAGTPYTIVPLEQTLTATSHSFTLSAFSNSSLTITEAAPRYPYIRRLSAWWSKDSAGGNAQHSTYSDNPQFSLTISQNTTISLLVEACNPNLNIHVKLLHSNGQRVHRVRNKDIIVDSKDYRPVCCLAELENLEPGQYTVICSTYEPQQLGDFTLTIESTQPVQATILPREGAGRIRTELSSVAFKRGVSKVATPLVPRRLVKIYAVAKRLDRHNAIDQQASRSHTRLSIELGTGPHRRILIASNSGEYADIHGTTRTDEIDLGPDFQKSGFRDCWLVLDRMYVNEDAQEESFAVELFVDQPDAVECGVWRSWED